MIPDRRTIRKNKNYALVKSFLWPLSRAACSDTRITFSASRIIYVYDNLRVVYGELRVYSAFDLAF